MMLRDNTAYSQRLSIFPGNCITITFLIVLLQLQDVQLKAEKVEFCSGPLGMESGDIPNTALSASSFYVTNVGPQQSRLNRDTKGGAWCPKEPIAPGVHVWLQVSLNGTHLVSGVQVQGRYSKGLGQEYAEEFQLEYWREGFTSWRKYYRFDGKSVFPGNTDTSSVVTVKLRPLLFAEKVRVVPHSAHRRQVCLRVELLGCPFRDGVIQYSTEQGDMFSEGISMQDESYDGDEGSKWDRRVGITISGEQSINSENFQADGDGGSESESVDDRWNAESDSDNVVSERAVVTSNTISPVEVVIDNRPRAKLSGGLGQLTDKNEGTNSFAMDIGYGIGNGWVGWRRRTHDDQWIELTFEFNTVRVFSHANIFSSNYPSKDVQFFSKCRVQFSNGGIYYSKHAVVEHSPAITTELSMEQTANLTIPLEYKIGKFLKFQLFFRSSWILVGEFYFHSQVFEGNWTEEEVDSPEMEFPVDTQAHLEVGDLNSSMVWTVVGTLCGLLLLSFVITAGVIWMRTKGSSLASVLKFSSNSGGGGGGGGGVGIAGITLSFPWRHSWNSVPTHIVTQSNAGNADVKDLMLTLNPGIENGKIGMNSNNMELQHLYAELGNNANSSGEGLQRLQNHIDQQHIKISTPPPPYHQINGHKLQVSQYNSSMGIDSGCYSNNASSTSSNINANSSPTKMTLRSNQLATMMDQGEDDEWMDEDSSQLSELAVEYVTGGQSSGNSVRRQTTSRRRKSKVAISSWNLRFEGNGRPIRNPRGTCISDVSLRQMRLVENLGSCAFGQVRVYDFEGEVESGEGTMYSNCRLIAKTIRSLSEIRLLNVLDHEHLLQMVCICTELKRPILALYPTPECGDLYSFLTHLPNTPSLGWLLRVASQIASGMSYLDSLHLVHRDLAARNCLVERDGTIRISDLAMACDQYRNDYCHTDQGFVPLRWWSWESILSGDFTIQSSVWSFGVTLWEILTLCRQRPLSHVADHQLRSLAETYRESTKTNQLWLPKPQLSPPEIFELMTECWRKEFVDRPAFQHIHLFLEQRCSNNPNSVIYHSVN